MHQTSLSIAAAARLCGVDRRTLQRAIHAGRLVLDAQHCLSHAALRSAGYLTPEAPQGRAAAAPHLAAAGTPQDAAPAPQRASHGTPQALDRIAEALTSIAASLGMLCERLTPQDTPQRQTAATPPVAARRTPQRHAAATRPSDATPYDLPRALARMQTLRTGGLSLAQIAAALNTEGVPTRHGKPWHKGTVGYLLQRRES